MYVMACQKCESESESESESTQLWYGSAAYILVQIAAVSDIRSIGIQTLRPAWRWTSTRDSDRKETYRDTSTDAYDTRVRTVGRLGNPNADQRLCDESQQIRSTG